MTMHKNKALATSALSQAQPGNNWDSNTVTEEGGSADLKDEEEDADDDFEDFIPSFEEDMAKNPGKSRKDIKYARGLWASGMIEIHNGAEGEDEDGLEPCHACHEGDFGPHSRVFVAKAPICAISKLFQELLPHDRSWPIVEWDVVVEDYPLYNAWYQIDAILRFVYRGELDSGGRDSYDSITEGNVSNWCLGNAMQCPKLQNETMKNIMKEDAAIERDWKSKGEKGSVLPRDLVNDCSSLMEDIGVVNKGDGMFEPHKLMSYMIDRLIWDATSGGFAYLKIVHQGGCVANMVARAQVDAAKKSPPRFAPWHVFNRHKYLMSEDLKTDRKRSKGADGGGQPTKKQRVG